MSDSSNLRPSSDSPSIDSVEQLIAHVRERERGVRRRGAVLTIIPLLAAAGWLVYGFLRLNHAERQVADEQAKVARVSAALQVQQQSLAARTRELEKTIRDAQLAAEDCPPPTSVAPRASRVALVLARPEQRAAVDQLLPYFNRVSRTPVRIITQKSGRFVPYATEVRYFRYPQDLQLAQSILLELQNQHGLPLSRVSYVIDRNAAPESIEVHFNASALAE